MSRARRELEVAIWEASEGSMEDAELIAAHVMEKLVLEEESVFEIPPWIQEPWVDEGRVHDASGKDVTDRLPIKTRLVSQWLVVHRG